MSPPGCRAMSKHEEPHDPLDTLSEGRWAQLPDLIRRDVEQHVLAHLPADLLAKWRTSTPAAAFCKSRTSSSIPAAGAASVLMLAVRFPHRAELCEMMRTP